MSLGSRYLAPMNVAEKARRDACVAAGCEACHQLGLPRDQHCGAIEYNHRLSGGRTVGHRWGYPLGRWHHQGFAKRGYSLDAMREKYGPNRRDEKGEFHARFGTDQSLQNTGDERIGYPREDMPSRRELRERGDGERIQRRASSCARPAKILPRNGFRL